MSDRGRDVSVQHELRKGPVQGRWGWEKEVAGRIYKEGKTAEMVQKSTIFWDITPCSPLSVNRRVHLQGRKIS
jgi:hypothetical protein